jgi:hypothetical protein
MRRLILLFLTAGLLVGCDAPSQVSATPTLTPSTLNRPASPVTITLVSPTNGEVVHGTVVHVVVAIQGGTVTPSYSTHISPTVGHVHLYMNGQLVYMTYTLHQDMPVNPGVSYSMYTEWVASDHFPFSPRDTTPPIVFTVAPA